MVLSLLQTPKRKEQFAFDSMGLLMIQAVVIEPISDDQLELADIYGGADD